MLQRVVSHKNEICSFFNSRLSDHKHYPFSLEFWLDNKDPTSSLMVYFPEQYLQLSNFILTQVNVINRRMSTEVYYVHQYKFSGTGFEVRESIEV